MTASERMQQQIRQIDGLTSARMYPMIDEITAARELVATGEGWRDPVIKQVLAKYDKGSSKAKRKKGPIKNPDRMQSLD